MNRKVPPDVAELRVSPLAWRAVFDATDGRLKEMVASVSDTVNAVMSNPQNSMYLSFWTLSLRNTVTGQSVLLTSTASDVGVATQSVEYEIAKAHEIAHLVGFHS